AARSSHLSHRSDTRRAGSFPLRVSDRCERWLDRAATMVHRSSTQADYGIVTALRDELTALRAALSAVEEVQLGANDIRYYHVGRLSCRDGSEVTVVCVCANEMGQQPALNATRDLIAAWKP